MDLLAVKTVPAQQGGLTFFVKPDEPPQVIGETAAIIWLKLCVKDLGGGNFDILSAGTGGGESEFD